MNKAVIELQNIKRDFQVGEETVHALRGVSFTINEGEFVTIMGTSGSGKSTLLNTLGCLDTPTSGEYLLDGISVRTMSKPQRAVLRNRKIGFVFQSYNNLPQYTALENVALPLAIRGVPEAERNWLARQALSRVGLRGHVDHRPSELSGGQQQRVGIARALAVKPEFIVCDEPISALDVSIQAQVVNMFEDLQQEMGLTYLFIAHDLSVVKHISNRIGVMYLGKMVELASAEEIYNHPLHPYSKSLLSAVPLPDPKAARANKRIVLSGDIPSPLNAPSGCPFRTRCPHATEACAQSMPPFNEVEKGHFVACHRVKELG